MRVGTRYRVFLAIVNNLDDLEAVDAVQATLPLKLLPCHVCFRESTTRDTIAGNGSSWTHTSTQSHERLELSPVPLDSVTYIILSCSYTLVPLMHSLSA